MSTPPSTEENTFAQILRALSTVSCVFLRLLDWKLKLEDRMDIACPISRMYMSEYRDSRYEARFPFDSLRAATIAADGRTSSHGHGHACAGPGSGVSATLMITGTSLVIMMITGTGYYMIFTAGAGCYVTPSGRTRARPLSLSARASGMPVRRWPRRTERALPTRVDLYACSKAGNYNKYPETKL